MHSLPPEPSIMDLLAKFQEEWKHVVLDFQTRHLPTSFTDVCMALYHAIRSPDMQDEISTVGNYSSQMFVLTMRSDDYGVRSQQIVRLNLHQRMVLIGVAPLGDPIAIPVAVLLSPYDVSRETTEQS